MTPAPAPAAPPEFTGCPPDWDAFNDCAKNAYWNLTLIPFAGPFFHNCLTNPADDKSGPFGAKPSPLDAVQSAQYILNELNQKWADAATTLTGIDLLLLSGIFTNLSSATGTLQTSIDVAFTPTRHLIAYLTVTIFFLGIIVAAVAWAV